MCKIKPDSGLEKPALIAEDDENSDDESDYEPEPFNPDSSDDESEGPVEPRPITTANIKKIDVMLLMFIFKSYQPVDIVEQEGFIRLTRAMHDGYVMPRRKDITRKILPEMYNKSMMEFKVIVQEQSQTICLSVDDWRMDTPMEFVVALTAHFITSDYELKSVLLKVCMSGSANEDLKNNFMETCEEWGILDKVNCWVTGTTRAVDILPEMNHIYCAGKKLQYSMKMSLYQCDVWHKVLCVIHFFQTNLKAAQMLEAYQTKAGVEEPLEFLNYEETVWISKYDMVERFLALREPILGVYAELKDPRKPKIKKKTWCQLELFCKLLKPFREVTRELIDDKYAPASKIIPIVHRLLKALEDARKKPEYYNRFRDLIEQLWIEVSERFVGFDSDLNLATCTVLDPRYKMLFLNESMANTTKLSLVSEIEQEIQIDTDLTDAFKINRVPITAYTKDGQTLSRKLALQEVESYLQEDVIDVDPFKWWKTNKSKYPYMSKIFRTRFNAVATGSTGQHLFTELGMHLANRRTLLSFKKAEMIVFLNANLEDDDYLRLMPDTYHDTLSTEST